MRDSETAAASSGVNLAWYKTLAFGISAAYAGVAGSLFAIATTFVNPDTFPIALSIFLLVGVVVGGLGSQLYGLVAGAVFIYFMQVSWAQQVDRGGPRLAAVARRHQHELAGRAGRRVRRRPGSCSCCCSCPPALRASSGGSARCPVALGRSH